MRRHSHGPRPIPNIFLVLSISHGNYNGNRTSVAAAPQREPHGRLAGTSCRVNDPTPRFHCRYRIVDSLSWPGHVSETTRRQLPALPALPGIDGGGRSRPQGSAHLRSTERPPLPPVRWAEVDSSADIFRPLFLRPPLWFMAMHTPSRLSTSIVPRIGCNNDTPACGLKF